MMFVRASDAVSGRDGGEQDSLLYNADTGQQRWVNPTGLFVWQRLSGQLPLDAIVGEVVEAFDVPDRSVAEADVTAYVTSIVESGFASQLSGPASVPAHTGPFPGLNDGPSTVDISLTGKCNLRCAYCYYADAMASRPDLPGEAWLKFFDELGSLAVRQVTLSGGEVFARRDLFDLIDGVVANRMRYSLVTNGGLITPAKVEQLVESRRRKRLGNVQVSIDGSCAETHDANRGEGSFDGAMRGLKLLLSAGLPVSVRVTITRHNVHDLERTAGLLLDELGVRSISTNETCEIGACTLSGDIGLRPEQELEAMRVLVELSRRYPGRATATAGPLAKWKMFREMEEARASGKPTNARMGTLSSCGCAWSKLAINHDGTITPCNMLADLTIGKMGATPVREIWVQSPVLAELKNRVKVKLADLQECTGCEWAPYCSGGCPAAPYTATGGLRTASRPDCYREFIRRAGRIPGI